MQFSRLCSSFPIIFPRAHKGKHLKKRLEAIVKIFSEYPLTHGSLTFTLGSVKQTLSALNHEDSNCENNQDSHESIHAHIHLHRPLKLLWKLYSQGHMGFAKAYIDGDISSGDLYTLLSFAFVNRQAFGDLDNRTHPLRSLSRLWHSRQHKKRHNSRRNARKNIAAHYDLGNDFYRLWLDDSMTYSSAYYDETNHNHSLFNAQQRKIQRIFDQLTLKQGQSLLEIGCGWGSFAHFSATQGISVKGLTLSKEQCHYANELFAQLPNEAASAQAHLQDYRDEDNTYDAIVSIEMFEAVGVDYWNTYFETLHRCLNHHGKALLQVITIEGSDEEVRNYQNGSDFIQTCIFPGGVLPSKKQLHQLASDHGFRVVERFDFGKDYAKTLENWRQQFANVTESLEALGYDQRFRLLWNYYLVYCQVGFERGRLDVVHLLLEKNTA